MGNKGRPKKGQKMYNQEPKKGEKLVPLMIGSYLTHNPFNVTYIQIVRSNNNGRSRKNITYQCNLPLYGKC